VEGAQLEGKQRGAVLLLPEGRREHRAHHEVHQVLVLPDDRYVVDGVAQLRRLLELLADDARQRAASEFPGSGRLRPERDQRLQAQLAPERQRLGRRCRLRLDVSRTGHETRRDSHAVIVPQGRRGATRALENANPYRYLAASVSDEPGVERASINTRE